MTTFLRLLNDKDKQAALVSAVRDGGDRVFEVDPGSFRQIPGAPFAYWVSEAVRETFRQFPAYEGEGRTVKVGIQTGDDFQFVRLWWEVENQSDSWVTFAKGGAYSPYYSSIDLVVNWRDAGKEIRNFIDPKSGNLLSRPQNVDYCFRGGLTWSDRTTSRLSARVWPTGGVFSVKGSAGFFPNEEFFAAAVMNSSAFDVLISLMVGAGDAAARSYQVGTIGKVPYPPFDSRLDRMAKAAWSLKRNLDTVVETSLAFLLPSALRTRLDNYDPLAIDAELAQIQAEIDTIAFDLYGFTEADRQVVNSVENQDDAGSGEDEEDEDIEADVPFSDALLSWAVGVVFGRFDWRLATGERKAPAEPEPFDPLPAKSPGMLPDGAEPFFSYSGILVDDQGHPHDMAHLVEEVLGRVKVPEPEDVRRWLQRDFFAFHLQRFSKSRRKAPIYWPLSTASGSYTLWVYYPDLSCQTLYTAVNDFIEPKLKQVGGDVAALRSKGTGRTRDDERRFEAQQAFEMELIELRDTLLKLAPTYKPNRDDGVQITAAPLWQLFRHKPWQKVLKDTWTNLEKGDYDWAHLAMNYWPDRVQEKCKTDKSLAIAHGLEDLYVEPAAKPKKARGRTRVGGDE